jgi:DNA-binding MarR family transcriptional regulator
MATATRSPGKRARVTQGEYEALAGFRSALRRFLAFSESAARSAGLTPRQHQALLAVKGAAGAADATVGDLAERLGVRHHSAVGLVDRLAALGLLKRETAAPDRRRVQLVLTPRGGRVLEGLVEAHREELREVAPRLETLLAALEAGPHGRARRARARKRPS